MLITIDLRGGDKSKTANKENKITTKEETPVQTVPLLACKTAPRTRELTEHFGSTIGVLAEGQRVRRGGAGR